MPKNLSIRINSPRAVKSDNLIQQIDFISPAKVLQAKQIPDDADRDNQSDYSMTPPLLSPGLSEDDNDNISPPTRPSTPSQFIFKKPSYDKHYHHTHFHHHHHQQEKKANNGLFKDLKKLFKSSSKSKSSNSSSTTSIKSSSEASFANEFNRDIEGKYGKWGKYLLL